MNIFVCSAENLQKSQIEHFEKQLESQKKLFNISTFTRQNIKMEP